MSNPDKQWAVAAIRGELDQIARCADESAHKPNSEWWRSVVRIASILKGSGKAHIAPGRVRAAIHRETPPHVFFKGQREKTIDYLFGRAMNRAHPRYRIKEIERC